MSAEPVTTATGMPTPRSSASSPLVSSAAEMDVEQDDGRPLALECRLGLRKRRCFADREPFELEVDPDEDTDGRVIVNDERAEASFHDGDANDYDPRGDGADRHEPALCRGAR